MRHKIKNPRSRSQSQQDEGRKRPRRSKSDAAVEKAGLPNYNGTAEPGSGRVQIEAVYRLKNCPDLKPSEKKKLKEDSFGARRKSLLRFRDPLRDVHERFPWLFCEDEICLLSLMGYIIDVFRVYTFAELAFASLFGIGFALPYSHK